MPRSLSDSEAAGTPPLDAPEAAVRRVVAAGKRVAGSWRGPLRGPVGALGKTAVHVVVVAGSRIRVRFDAVGLVALYEN